MTQTLSHIELLMQLGLTFNEAKVFLALSEHRPATTKIIAKTSGVTREFTYRILPILHKKGLIEEAITSPKTFKAIPLTEAYENLLRLKEKENQELETKIKETLKNHQNTTSAQSEDIQTVVLPSGAATKSRFDQEFKVSKKSVKMIIPLEKLLRAPQNDDGKINTNKKIMKKNKVITQIITELPPPQLMAKEHKRLTPDLDHELRFIEHSQYAHLVEIVIIDEKKLFISTSKESQLEKMTWLYSNNPFIAEMANSYFNTLWTTSKNHL